MMSSFRHKIYVTSYLNLIHCGQKMTDDMTALLIFYEESMGIKAARKLLMKSIVISDHNLIMFFSK